MHYPKGTKAVHELITQNKNQSTTFTNKIGENAQEITRSTQKPTRKYVLNHLKFSLEKLLACEPSI